MTKQHENGELTRTHVHINSVDWALIKTLAKTIPGLSPSELVRELISNSLRGLRPGQIVAYDRLLNQDLQKAQFYLDRAAKRTQAPKQRATTLSPKGSPHHD